MFLEFINTMTSSKHKLLSLSNLPVLPTSILPTSAFSGEKMYLLPIVGHPFIKAGGRTFQKFESLGGA